MKHGQGPGSKEVTQYISRFPEPVRSILVKFRGTIRKAAPQAVETLKYGIPTYVMKQNLVHFAGYKRHIGFYPTPSAIRFFAGRLEGFKTSRGAVRFPLTDDIPYELIAEITRHRVSECESLERDHDPNSGKSDLRGRAEFPNT